MSTPRLAALLAVLLSASLLYAQDEGPLLGVEVSDAEIAAWDLSIGPDGANLPEGSGTASEGEAIYRVQCLACHGEGGQGQLNDRLVGGHGSLSGQAPVKTIGSFWPYATTVFDYIRRAMPYTSSQSLLNEEVYALTAYLLYMNDIVTEDEIMNADSLPLVRMPNRDNFVLVYSADVK